MPPDGQMAEPSEPTRNGHIADSPADLEAMKERYWELTFRLYQHTEQLGDKAERSELNRRIESITVAHGAGKTTSEYVAWQREND